MNPAVEYITKIAAGTALCIAGAACQSWIIYAGLALIAEPIIASYIASLNTPE